ncbi:sla2 Src-like adaptor 2 [Savitreella phatthalungensis]
MFSTNNQFRDGPSRNVDQAKQESELGTNIKKATSAEETAPKRKHVRACIVYTWDHQSSSAFWSALKVQPILSDEVQTFKAIIVVHKVIQEGSPITLLEAHRQTGWLETVARSVHGDGTRGYGRLIKNYVDYLVSKLSFHRYHGEFNGTFEYEEYVTLKNINDPNEGFEVIMALMDLQDQIDSLQKLVFSSFRKSSSNECKISALVPLVHESYGIYKFITSMLRALYQAGADDAVEPLKDRYTSQHHRLVKFYYECSNLRYLTNLIAIPKLPQEPPDLHVVDGDQPPLKINNSEPSQQPARQRTPAQPEAEQVQDFWSQQQAEQAEYEAEQRRLREEADADARRQQELMQQREADFQRQQAMLAEQQRLAEQQLLQQQYQQQSQGRVAELEQQLLAMQGQFNNDQLMLEQYDQRVKMLEQELQQLHNSLGAQSQSKDDLIRSLQDQLTAWKQKYEALAKLYTQLRQEHMDLLAKYKTAQLKASSAQEAIDRKEKMERDLKNKNLDLADMIRERDRARLELDKLRNQGKDSVEAKERELREALDRIRDMERTSGSELASVVNRNNREIANLEELLRTKQRQLDEATQKLQDKMREIDNIVRDKDEELEIYKTGMDEALLRLNDVHLNGGADEAMNEQIDQLILGQIDKLNEIIDAVLDTAAKRLDEALYMLDNPMEAGNQNVTPEYLLSILENTSVSANDFATSVNNFVADGPNADQAEIIASVDQFANSIVDTLYNTKGALRLTGSEQVGESLTRDAKSLATLGRNFLLGVRSPALKDQSLEQKTDTVINYNIEAQQQIQGLSKVVEGMVPKDAFDIVAKSTEDIGDLVDRELSQAATAIEAAAARLAEMAKRNKSSNYSPTELRVHESLVEAAQAIITAIAALLTAATDSQREIVDEGRGTSSRTNFYKRNHRWTEGLISAAKAVANATNTLIETADGVLLGTNSLEQVIVASNNVASATAQLVAASRVKQSFMSKTQGRLEEASKRVNAACRNIVRLVQQLIADRSRAANEATAADYEALGAHEFKKQEMEQQVLVLKLENELAMARSKLGVMRRTTYHTSLE